MRVGPTSYDLLAEGIVADGSDQAGAINDFLATITAGTVWVRPGATIGVGSPIAGRSGVTFAGTRGRSVLRGLPTLADHLSATGNQGCGVIEYQGPTGTSDPATAVTFTDVAVEGLTFDMTAVPDTPDLQNKLNAIYQDHSVLRHARFTDIGYVGLTQGQCILLQGLGRIRGSWSRDIVIDHIHATNGAGTVSAYLNSVADATATYSGLDISHIHDHIDIDGLQDDRVAICGNQVDPGTTPNLIGAVSVHDVFVDIDPAVTTGLVNGVKVDACTGTVHTMVDIGGVWFQGNGSVVAGSPVMSFADAASGIQELSVHDIHADRCCGIYCQVGRHGPSPRWSFKGVRGTGLVHTSTTSNVQCGVRVVSARPPAGDELLVIEDFALQTAEPFGENMVGLFVDARSPDAGLSGLVKLGPGTLQGFNTGIACAYGTYPEVAFSLADITMIGCDGPLNLSQVAEARSRNVTGVPDR